MLNPKILTSFHIFSPSGIVLSLLAFLALDARPVFYAIEGFLVLNFLYRYLPVLMYALRSRTIGQLLEPLPFNGDRHKHLLVLVPARNEALALPGLLHSINMQAYPQHYFQVIVVADNCTDDTAAVARSYGTRCIEKNTTDAQPGKAACLGYAAGVLQQEGIHHDTYFVVVDADCELDVNFLSEINKQLQAPSAPQVLQSYRYVLNNDASEVARLDAASEGTRQLIVLGTRHLLGLNAFLHGSGSVFERSVFLSLMDRSETSAAEDKEWNAWLLQQRVRIGWCPSAHLAYNVYESNDDFQRQRVRWVRGQFITARKYAARSFFQGLIRRNLSQVDFACSLYQLPRSVFIFTMLLCSMVNYFYFEAQHWAYTWVGLCLAAVACELLPLAFMGGQAIAYRQLVLAGFKMVWGVARSSVLYSVSARATRWWSDRRGIFKS